MNVCSLTQEDISQGTTNLLEGYKTQLGYGRGVRGAYPKGLIICRTLIVMLLYTSF